MNSDILKAGAAHVRKGLPQARPRWAIILGSGWGVVAEAFKASATIPYAEIPGYGETQVAGHAGRLILAQHQGTDLLIFQGRRHWYEGAGWEPVAMPIAIARSLGISTIVLTNAAGGIRSDLHPGDIMVIDDHINALGASPLIGPHDPFWGPRFPDMSTVYRRPLRQLLDRAARQLDHPVAHGVYLASSGPAYETPAEIRAFERLGADAVGMSTVPEAILANAAGMQVVGLSCITNFAAGVMDTPLSHSEVIEETQRAQAPMRRLITTFFDLLAESAEP
ncbi:MAG: purine-nucleoside phosphorylase [Verrucomicrobia bacterium]|nr:purine-nucleoside phosphorylase [Verrucomicrobiota bacterium]